MFFNRSTIISSGLFMMSMAPFQASASPSLLPLDNDYHALATATANDVIQMANESVELTNNRRLNSQARQFFATELCPAFERGFREGAPGSSCSCRASSYSIVCTAPQFCEPNDDCDGDQLCGRNTIETDFSLRGDMLVLTAITMETDFTNADYDSTRIEVTENSCSAHFVLDGKTYQCKTCQVCNVGTSEGAVNLDCSNIQDGAAEFNCFDAATANADTSFFFDYCPEGGAPEPTSGRLSTNDTPSPLSSTSAAGTVSMSFTVVVGVASSILFVLM